jgi:hypothetical protein
VPKLAALEPRGHAYLIEQMTGEGLIDQVMHKVGIDQAKKLSAFRSAPATGVYAYVRGSLCIDTVLRFI